MDKNHSFPVNTPVYLLAFVLAVSPVVRFSWDLWSQTVLHIVLAAALVLLLAYRTPRFRLMPHGSFLLLFAGACVSLWHNPDAAAIRNNLLVLFDALIAGFLFTAMDPGQRRKLLHIPVLAGFFFSIILLFFTLTSYNAGYLEPDAIVNINVIAGYLVLAFPLSFVLWDTHGKQGLFISAVLFTGILLTHSRAAMLFAFIAAALFLWQKGGRSRRVLAFTAALFLAVLAYAATLKTGQDSLGSRLLWWESAVRIFLAHPVNGAGWGNFGSVFPVFKAGEGLNTLYAHNIFLQILAEGGILAFIPFCALLCAFIFSRDRSSRLPLLLSAGSFIAVNLFDYSFFIPAVMLLFFSVVGASFDGEGGERGHPVPAWITLPVIAMLSVLFLVPLQANRRYQDARYFLTHDDPAAAEQALRSARRLDPLPYQYYSASAETAFARYAGSKDPAALREAIGRQKEALARFPVCGRLWADLSWLYLSAGDNVRAVEAMRAAAAYDMTTPRYRRALASFEQGKADTRHAQ